MSEFKLSICRELPVVEIGYKYYLLDTLCRNTRVDGPVVIDDSDFSTGLDVARSTAEDCSFLSQVLGAHINGVLGADFLCNFHTIVDYRGGSIYVSRRVRDFCGWTAQNLDANWTPIVEMTINSESKRFLLSTGFGIGYLRDFKGSSRDLILREYCDGASLQTQHVTDVFCIRASYGPCCVKLRIGQSLPAGLDAFLQNLHADGVVGYDFFSRFKVGLNCFGASFNVCESIG